jgi:hypothetical protein
MNAAGRKTATMVEEKEDERFTYVFRHAYQLARTGKFDGLDSIQAAITAEGYPEAHDWLERPSIRDSIREICSASQQGRPTSWQLR